MTQAEYPAPREIHAIDIRSANVAGYIAISDDGESWICYVPGAAGLLVHVLDIHAARAFAQELPANGSLYFPTPIRAKCVRLSHRGGLLSGFVPREPSAAPATEATLREILDAIRALRSPVA